MNAIVRNGQTQRERDVVQGAYLNELQSINEQQIKICFYCAQIRIQNA